ncbi:MAG: MEKHLA domain-containing protein [Anaerolineae bacterium]|nr:MEKHLA domain-containing protein [Phycisphaerae bacterium]
MADFNADDIEKVAAQARLAAIIESSDDAIVSKTLEGVVTSWNRGAQRIFGHTAEEMIGMSILKLIPPDRQHEEPNILARIATGERIDHYETIRVTKDGRRIDVSVTISPIRDPSGRVIGVSKIARDVTQQKRLQKELTQAKEAAESANIAKDHFLSLLSHELRTPLTPVLTAITYIESVAEVPPELSEQLGMIRRNIEIEARLVDDLLDVTRIARGKVQLHYEVVDAHAAVRNVVAIFQPEIDEKGLALTLALRAKEFTVWADPGRFQQIFLNLLSNAVKFTPANGTIAITSSDEKSGRIQIEVSDTGAGINAAVLPKLFNAFEQGDASVTKRFGGLGLGLSIVRSLAEMHGGTIRACSEGKDKGASFVLSISTVPGVEKQNGIRDSAAGLEYQGMRILLVEDHTDTRQIMAKLLGSFGCIVTTASSVREAMQCSQTEKFDLLVSDIGLPDGSGLDVMRHMKQHQQVRGIALSGFGQDDDLRRSREAGFETHLIKPVNLQALQEVIRKTAG